MFKTKNNEALSINNCSDLFHSLWSFSQAAAVNNCSVHHFSSEYPIDDEMFEIIVKLANTTKSNKKLLDTSRINM